MKHELNIWVVGGDMRQAKLAQLLALDGHTVHPPAVCPGDYAQVSESCNPAISLHGRRSGDQSNRQKETDADGMLPDPRYFADNPSSLHPCRLSENGEDGSAPDPD